MRRANNWHRNESIHLAIVNVCLKPVGASYDDIGFSDEHVAALIERDKKREERA